MTISTVTFQQNALYDLEAIQTAMSKTQNQLSTGLKLNTAADDPVAFAEVNQLDGRMSASTQYASNGNLVSGNLKLEEQALTNATNLLQSVQSLATEANNGSMNGSDLADIATQIEQQLGSLTDIANSTDSNGNYLFAGDASRTQPFARSGNTVSYVGSASVNQIQVGPAQFVSSGDTGSSVFMGVPAGNGTFTTAAAAANTGSASIDTGTVTDPSAWVPDIYTIKFTSPGAYTVTDSSGATVTSGSYASGDSIAFDGIAVTVSGTPAAGDEFTVAPAGSTSAFGTLSNLVTTLKSTSLTAGERTTQIEGALTEIGNALNQLSTVQASVGARVDAVTTAQSNAQSTQTTLQQTVSQLSDTDYAAATTQLSTEEIALQAAEESYASIAKLSLFNYVS